MGMDGMRLDVLHLLGLVQEQEACGCKSEATLVSGGGGNGPNWKGQQVPDLW